MNGESAPLLEDPIFQLNFALWMLEPLPRVAPIRPLLREAQYILDSISRDLPIRPDLRPALAKIVGTTSAPAPDVLAQGSEDDWLIIECKGKSFGAESSNANQARKLLAGAADLTGALGLPMGRQRAAHIVYLTTKESNEVLVETLLQLQRELETLDLGTGQVGGLGLSRRDDGVYIEPSGKGQLPAKLGVVLPEPTRVIEVSNEDDPRPLYLIPWDPSVTQEPQMKNYCRSILFSRLTAEAASSLGRSQVPARVALPMEQLLSEATFGVSRKWRSKGDLAKVLLDAKRFLGDAFGPLRDRLSVAMPSGPERIEVTLSNDLDQEAAIDALMSADPLGGPSPDPENQPSLFEPPFS